MTRPSLTTLILNIPSIQRCFKQFEHRDVTSMNIYEEGPTTSFCCCNNCCYFQYITYLKIWKNKTFYFSHLACLCQCHLYFSTPYFCSGWLYVKSCVSECPRCVWLLVFIGPIVWPQNQHPPPPANDNHNNNPGPVSRLKPGSLWRLSLANQRPASGSRDQHWPIRGRGAAREIVTSNYHGRGENFKGLEDD